MLNSNMESVEDLVLNFSEEYYQTLTNKSVPEAVQVRVDFESVLERREERIKVEAVKAFANDIYGNVAGAYILNPNYDTETAVKKVEAILNAKAEQQLKTLDGQEK